MKKKTKKQYFYNDYTEKVLKNEILTCKWVKKACQRYFDDLENGKARGIWFDEKAAHHIIDFFEYIPKHLQRFYEFPGRVQQLPVYMRARDRVTLNRALKQ